MGQNEMDAVLPMIHRTIKLGFYILVPLGILVLLIPETVIAIYTDDVSLMAAGVAPLFVLVFAYAFTIPQRVLLSAVLGTGNTKEALWIEFAALVVYILYIYVVIFYYKSPLWVCWTCEFVYGIPSMLMAWKYLHDNRWRMKKI